MNNLAYELDDNENIYLFHQKVYSKPFRLVITKLPNLDFVGVDGETIGRLEIIGVDYTGNCVRVTVWRKLAERLFEILHAGDAVLIKNWTGGRKDENGRWNISSPDVSLVNRVIPEM